MNSKTVEPQTNRTAAISMQRTRALSMAAILVTVSMLAPARVRAAGGALDSSFGTGGIVLTEFSQASAYAFAIRVQPDGKVIVAGQSGVYPVFHAALARYNADGTPDPTFGTGGKVTVPLDPDGEGLSAIALQPDGKIVAAGSVIHDNWPLAVVVARFNADGSLDQEFGSGGAVVTTFGDPFAEGNDVVLQPDGKIVVVGVSGAGDYSELNDFAVARYNPDGSLDQGFGNGGQLKTHFPGVFNTGTTASSAALQADGKLVVAGTYKNEGTHRQFAMARYNTDGTLDSKFGSAGEVMTTAGLGDSGAYAIALQPDGRIVLAGYSYSSHGRDFTLARYGSDGTLDGRFGQGGVVQTDFANNTDFAYALAVQGDGKLVAAGRTGPYPQTDVGLARYTTAGQLDQTFGSGGKVVTNTGSSDQAYAVAIYGRARIVVAGISLANGSTFDFAVARYLGR